MSANRPIKALEGFGWADADIGAECTRCGWTKVYCAFEAVERFRERRWSTDIIEATRRFRCCGEVRLVPVPIHKRQQPLPERPTPLRPIYKEESRLLRRRGRMPRLEAPDVAEALETLRAAAELYPRAIGTTDAVRAAADLLRPLVYHAHHLDDLLEGLSSQPVTTRPEMVRNPITHILRQLGRPRI